jgi:hypothetical protein
MDVFLVGEEMRRAGLAEIKKIKVSIVQILSSLEIFNRTGMGALFYSFSQRNTCPEGCIGQYVYSITIAMIQDETSMSLMRMKSNQILLSKSIIFNILGLRHGAFEEKDDLLLIDAKI